MDETTQNPGKTEAGALTPKPDGGEDSLEHVLDAWAAEPSARKRYDRLRLERRDGEALEVLLDAETARDLGDKLTIVAARSRQRSRGEAPVATDRALDPGAAEDLARAQKVLALMGLPALLAMPKVEDVLAPMVDEFRASREDVAKAHAMIDAQREKHARDLEEIGSELASVKADRDNLIAEAAQRDIDAEDAIDLSDPSEPASP